MKGASSDIAYNYIKKRIQSGEYPPSFQLLTNDLAHSIGVSRTPIREAMHQLEADGLIVIRSRLGAHVREINLKEHREICGLRVALESYAAGLAAVNRTDAELREIGFALEEMRKLTDQLKRASNESKELIEELIREDIRFHIGIINAAQSGTLKDEILRLHVIDRVVSGEVTAGEPAPLSKQQSDSYRADALTSHGLIFAAIVKGDATAARLNMEAHTQENFRRSHQPISRSDVIPPARPLTKEELNYMSLVS